MGRKESVSLQVAPDKEQSTIDFMGQFHWELASSQTIDTKDSHLEQAWTGDLYSVTEHEKYVKLVFQRDIDQPNYKRIKELEAMYKTAPEHDSRPKDYSPGRAGITIFYVSIIAGVIFGIEISIIFLIIFPIAGYYFWKRYAKSPAGLKKEESIKAKIIAAQKAYDKAKASGKIMTKYEILQELKTL